MTIQPRDVCNACRIQSWISYCFSRPCSLKFPDAPKWVAKKVPEGRMTTEGNTLHMPHSNAPASLDGNGEPLEVTVIALPQHVDVRSMGDLQRVCEGVAAFQSLEETFRGSSERAETTEKTERTNNKKSKAQACVCWCHNGIIQFAGVAFFNGRLKVVLEFERLQTPLLLLFERLEAENEVEARKRLFSNLQLCKDDDMENDDDEQTKRFRILNQ